VVPQIVELLSGEAGLPGHDGERPIADLLLPVADPGADGGIAAGIAKRQLDMPGDLRMDALRG